MAHSHRASAHGDGDSDLPVGRTVRLTLLVALATVGGVVVLWPDAGKLDTIRQHRPFAAPGVTTVTAEVTHVAPACTGTTPPAGTRS